MSRMCEEFECICTRTGTAAPATIRLVLRTVMIQWPGYSSVGKTPGLQYIDHRFESRCQRGLILVWAFSRPSHSKLLVRVRITTLKKGGLNQWIYKGQDYSTVVKDPSLPSQEE